MESTAVASGGKTELPEAMPYKPENDDGSAVQVDLLMALSHTVSKPQNLVCEAQSLSIPPEPPLGMMENSEKLEMKGTSLIISIPLEKLKWIPPPAKSQIADATHPIRMKL